MPRGRPKQVRTSRRPPMGVQFRMEIPAGVEVPDNKVCRWVTDAENRVEAFLERDWQVVRWPEGAQERNARAQPGADVRRTLKSGQSSVLMMIDRDLFEEDKAAKHEQTLLSEIDTPKEGAVPEYVPEDHKGQALKSVLR